jgi:hypothetical protein
VADVLRIKRRALGGAAGAPGSLAVGELAFNEVDGGLYIGRSNGSVVQVNTGGGSGLNLLSVQTVTNNATLDFVNAFNSTYNEYEIHIHDLIFSVINAVFGLRYGQSGAFKSDASYKWSLYNSTDAGSGGAVGASGDGQFQLINSCTSSAVSVPATGVVRIFNPLGGTYFKNSQWRMAFYASNANMFNSNGSGSYVGNLNAVNDLRFLVTAGVMTTGTFRLYGIKT